MPRGSVVVGSELIRNDRESKQNQRFVAELVRKIS